MAPPPGPYSGTSTLALVARASAFTFGVVYGNMKLKVLKNVLGPSTSSLGDISYTNVHNNYLLSRGRAFSISLTYRTVCEEVLKLCCPFGSDETDESLVYKSSLHGKGLNRFWSKVEGYHGPLLILVSAVSKNDHGGDASARKWIIGALTDQGFENRDAFYGSAGNLYSISPVFHAFLPSGKEKNFVYSHLHPTGKVYESHPKPVGIVFGGTIGNERIFIDEDFAKITVHHHAVDKTYRPGSLIP
ncbi:uncharacterized protein LOC123203584 isoform X1 [Mangifera indica]|uniref:uncharacterized protein LOC123203584 isoform X1 n=1 Tax=Mangifera indica TaxID=29780 RepID=UPI001CFAB1D7|nr:uncharacterized protein LOC123203584 isoform X1 [Mangifera indica]